MVHVQSGFLGHENDANCYRQIEMHLCNFLINVIFLENLFTKNGYPVITPYKSTDKIRTPRAVKRARRKFNRLHRRVFVRN